MGRRTRVVLYGNSVILAGVGATLERLGTTEVIPLDPPLPGPAELEEIRPDVVLFDAGEGRPEDPFSLLERSPGLLLVGLSPDGNDVRLWSGRQFSELSIRELLSLVEEHVTEGVQGGADTVPKPGRV